VHGISIVRKKEDLVGIGCGKKRMPFYNGMDRGFYNERIICRGRYPIRKDADFQCRYRREEIFLKIHYHCIVVSASTDSTTIRKGKGRR
jgi:hypothetical protein